MLYVQIDLRLGSLADWLMPASIAYPRRLSSCLVYPVIRATGISPARSRWPLGTIFHISGEGHSEEWGFFFPGSSH